LKVKTKKAKPKFTKKGEIKMKGRDIFVIFLAVMVFGSAISFVYADDKVDLRLRLEKGQSYKLRTSQELKINQTVPGQGGQQQTMTMTQKSVGRDIYTVEDVQADGTIVLKVTYDAMIFKQENPWQNQKIEYDSTDTSVAVGPMTPILDAIVGKSFTITIAPDGHVKEIQGADVILKRIREKINELPDDQMRAKMEMEAQFGMQYGEETLKANTESSFNMYPDNPVSIGDTWQRKATMNKGFPMIVDTIYTLKERKDGVAVIDIFAMIQTNRDTGPTEMGGVKLQYNMSGSVTGLMEMQESTGWPIRSNQGLRLTGNITVQSPDMAQPMAIPMSITGPITIEPY
jgi:hypothetical protein